MPVGPLELLDQVGIDIAADVAKTFAALTCDPGPVPARFAEMVKDGALGKKAAAGSTSTRTANAASRPVGPSLHSLCLCESKSNRVAR